MGKKILLLLILIVLVTAIFNYSNSGKKSPINIANNLTDQLQETAEGVLEKLNPLTIESLRNGTYPGSELTIEETLVPGSNYQRYIASYKSEGNKIYALLTIPNGDPSTGSGQEPPKDGWPVIIFNHGFIPPAEYRTTERYIAYTDAFSRNGYVVLRSDYRGHGNSEGQATGGYGSNGYTIDVLNAIAAIKKYNSQLSSGKKIVDVNRIGMWGHSMGGFITLRSMVVNTDIKAGVIWGGVVASYPDLINNWRRRPSITPTVIPPGGRAGWRQSLMDEYGTPEKNPTFWNSISANSYLADISGPIQLHHGEADTSVPVDFSRKLADQMKKANKEVEIYTYPGDDHDITANFGIAMQRSVEFFDRYLKK